MLTCLRDRPGSDLSLVVRVLVASVATAEADVALDALSRARLLVPDRPVRGWRLEAPLVAAIRPGWGPAAVAALIEAVGSSPHADVRAVALESLAAGHGAAAETVALDVLAHHLDGRDPDRDIREEHDSADDYHRHLREHRAAIAVLVDAASSAALACLYDLAERDTFPRGRHHAMVALGRVHHPQALDLLTAALDDPRRVVGATLGLGELGDPRPLPALRSLAELYAGCDSPPHDPDRRRFADRDEHEWHRIVAARMIEVIRILEQRSVPPATS